MKQLILLVAIVAFSSFVMAQPTAPIDVKETETAASKALEALRQLATRERFKDLGFESADEVSKATLSEPLAVYAVRLDQLRAFQSGSDPEKLLQPLSEVIYPVAVGEHVRSAVVIEKTNKGWEATTFGRPNLIKLLTDTRHKTSSADHLALSAHFAVSIPALYAYFIGYRADGKLMLASVIDDAALKLSAAQPQPAGDVFAGLVQPAKETKDQPTFGRQR